MSQLRLQRRDDPLAIGEPTPQREDQATEHTTAATQGAAKERASARSSKRGPRPRTPRSEAKRSATADAPPQRRQRGSAQRGSSQWQRTYDDDRLEQTGWRIYESLLAEVKTRAEELSAAGIPTSAAALAAATLHSHLPRSIEDGAALMRPYRQATAGRQRARRGA